MIVADTDFLSSFAKIYELDLVFKVIKTKEIIVTRAVYDELKESPVFDLLLPYFSAKDKKITIKKASAEDVPEYLGAGERESIAISNKNKVKLLMDDRVAGKYAENIGVKVVDIPAFLFYCKEKNFLNVSRLKNIISKLKAKDFYEFEEKIEQALISNN